MPKVILIGDIGTEHDAYQRSLVIEGSPTVTINDKQVARLGDALESHSDSIHPPHKRKIQTGSATVFIDGKPVAVEGGNIDCGGVLIASQDNVVIGYSNY